MTTAVLDPIAPGRLPLWQMIVASFLPVDRRAAANRWVRRAPLLLIFAIQAALTLRLSNTAYRDEGLYIYTGHLEIAHILHGAPLYDEPAKYFSGSPLIYPIIAAGLDRLGGLTLVRLFSLVLMLGATFAVYAYSKRLFNQKAAVWGALAFVVAGPTAYLGNYATFDALALTCMAVALALGVRASQTANYWLAPVVGSLLALGVMSKYATALFVPFVLLLLLAVPARRRSARLVGLISGSVTAGILAGVGLTVGRPELEGLKKTTTSREVITYQTFSQIVHSAWLDAGVFIVAGLLGAVYVGLRLHRARTALLLFIAGIAPILNQARIHEGVSLDKHIGFGLVFIAPLCGVLISASYRRMWVKVGALVVLVCLVLSGLQASRRMFSQWSNSSEMTALLGYSLRADPYIHILGDAIEPQRYAYDDQTKLWQWSSTDSVYYNGLTGQAAATAGLQDHYWQYVYFNSSTKISSAMMPRMIAFGYKLTNTVTLHNSKYGNEVYYVYQNYEPRGAALKN